MCYKSDVLHRVSRRLAGGEGRASRGESSGEWSDAQETQLSVIVTVVRSGGYYPCPTTTVLRSQWSDGTWPSPGQRQPTPAPDRRAERREMRDRCVDQNCKYVYCLLSVSSSLLLVLLRLDRKYL